MITGFVGLGTMLAVAAFPVYMMVAEAHPSVALLSFGCAMLVFVCYTHRSNIDRMRHGSENRVRASLAVSSALKVSMAPPRSNQAQARRLRLLSLLADGEFHSGEKLAKRLRVSRGGVWKLIHTLRTMGVEIESVSRQGYRLPRAVDLLNRQSLLESISAQAQSLLDEVDVMLTVDSTNRYVYDNVNVSPGHAQLCIAEIQNAGRGRRGRTWMAPFGSGICMSIGWQFHGIAADVLGVESRSWRCRSQGIAIASAPPKWV